MRWATLLAAVAGVFAVPMLVLSVEIAARVVAGRGRPVARSLVTSIERVLRPLSLARAEGALPTDWERLRLQAAAGAGGFMLGAATASTRVGLALAVVSFWLASRSLIWHRDRYRRRLDDGAPAAALALADALAAGRSVRGALALCGHGLGGPIGAELRMVGDELEMGAETEHSLESLRARARSRRVDLIVAAVRIQRRSGGSLAMLLRQIAATLEDHDRLDDEMRAATAQARFTSVVVLLLPLAGVLLAELAAPGIIGRMTDSDAGMWLLGAALVLQLAGVLLIRRLARVDR